MTNLLEELAISEVMHALDANEILDIPEAVQRVKSRCENKVSEVVVERLILQKGLERGAGMSIGGHRGANLRIVS